MYQRSVAPDAFVRGSLAMREGAQLKPARIRGFFVPGSMPIADVVIIGGGIVGSVLSGTK